MKTKISTYTLADKSKLKVGDSVLFGNEIVVLTLIENGGSIGEVIHSDKYYLSNSQLFTKDINKI